MDPAYTAGDLLKGDAEAFMPLYRVKLSGINATNPEPMFSVLTPLATIGDSVSRHKSMSNGSIVARIDGGVVTVWSDLNKVTSAVSPWSKGVIGKLPEEYRPTGSEVGGCAYVESTKSTGVVPVAVFWSSADLTGNQTRL